MPRWQARPCGRATAEGSDTLNLTPTLYPGISQPARAQVMAEEDACIRVRIETGDTAGFQFKTHPNIDKALYGDNLLGLKDPERPFPVGNPLGILKWRFEARARPRVASLRGAGSPPTARRKRRSAPGAAGRRSRQRAIFRRSGQNARVPCQAPGAQVWQHPARARPPQWLRGHPAPPRGATGVSVSPYATPTSHPNARRAAPRRRPRTRRACR